MRYINPRLVNPHLPEGWDQRAELAEAAVAGVRPQDRAAEMARHARVWQEVKGALKKASKNKCWYCESRESRSDNAVDHFRPKNAVAECPEHDGYWWLAFKWENYRYCCTYCNCWRVVQSTGRGGGKADHFPLRVEESRAHTLADDLANEEPLLLDPCVPADPGLLWFDETGQAVPSPVCGKDGNRYPYQRATTSIDVYHLNQPDLVDQRKVLCSEIRRRVGDADRYFGIYNSGDATARSAFEDAVRDLRDYLPVNAEYSSASRAMLMGLRGTHPVVDVILAAV